MKAGPGTAAAWARPVAGEVELPEETVVSTATEPVGFVPDDNASAISTVGAGFVAGAGGGTRGAAWCGLAPGTRIAQLTCTEVCVSESLLTSRRTSVPTVPAGMPEKSRLTVPGETVL